MVITQYHRWGTVTVAHSLGGAQWFISDNLMMNHCALKHCAPDVPRGHLRLKNGHHEFSVKLH